MNTNSSTSGALFGASVALALTFGGLAQERDRGDVPARFKWNLTDLYPDNAAWQSAKDRLIGAIPELRQYQGKLISSSALLADALDMTFALEKELSRLWVYSSLLADEDTRDAQGQGMRQEMVQLGAMLESEAAYIAPEILRGDKQTLRNFIASDSRLSIYRFYLDEIIRREAHTLTESEERILAAAGPLSSGASNVYNILSNADFPYPAVTLSDGRSVTLDHSTFSDLRALPNREDREKVMSSFFLSHGAFRRTFGATMDAGVQRALFYSKARKYPSALEMSLDGPNIPVTVYTRLIDGVNRNLSTFHRYLKLRQRMLGVEQLHYYDLYAPLVDSVKLEYTLEEAQQHVLAAVAPLGPEYASVIQRAYEDRWIDFLPSTGKRSGAYSSGGAYDVHPYILMNFNGKYTDVGTLAHELGHTMHSYFSNRTQSYATASYPTFLAEVASTFNESLLIDYMLQNITDPDARLSLLGNYVENIKTTVFRQAQFAEFELRLHEMAQAGRPIVGDALASLYMDVTRKYYGHEQGVCIVDDYIAHEWSFVPHFYREFYVFQYATSFTASEALAAKVKAGEPGARERYMALLSAGGSKYPIDLLKDAGVDMTTDEPLDLTIQAMNHAMDEMERLLANR